MIRSKRLLSLAVVSLSAVLLLSACGHKSAAPAASPTPAGQAAQGGGTAQQPSAAPSQPSAAPSQQPSTAPSQAPGTATAKKSWSSPPPMTIDKSKSYTAEFDTNKGKFTVELFAKDAPITVNNFVFLSNQHFYDGVTFHRIIKTFMIQTGDPTGTGTGGPGYTIQDELKSPYKYEPGIVAMANTGQPNSGGSQFFICTGNDSTNLNQIPDYAIFGKVKDGMDVVQKIAATPVKMVPGGMDTSPSMPTEKVMINTIKITEK